MNYGYEKSVSAMAPFVITAPSIHPILWEPKQQYSDLRKEFKDKEMLQPLYDPGSASPGFHARRFRVKERSLEWFP